MNKDSKVLRKDIKTKFNELNQLRTKQVRIMNFKVLAFSFCLGVILFSRSIKYEQYENIEIVDDKIYIDETQEEVKRKDIFVFF